MGIPLNTGEQATDRMPQAKQAAPASAQGTVHNSCCDTYVKRQFPGCHICPPRSSHTCQKLWKSRRDDGRGNSPELRRYTRNLGRLRGRMNRRDSMNYVRMARCSRSTEGRRLVQDSCQPLSTSPCLCCTTTGKILVPSSTSTSKADQ